MANSSAGHVLHSSYPIHDPNFLPFRVHQLGIHEVLQTQLNSMKYGKCTLFVFNIVIKHTFLVPVSIVNSHSGSIVSMDIVRVNDNRVP